MEKHQHSLNVECPQCHHVFDVEASLTQQIKKSVKAELARDQKKALDELDAQRQKLESDKLVVARQQATIQHQVDLRVKQERESIKVEALKEANKATAEEMEAMRLKTEQQGAAISTMKKEKLSLLQEKQTLEKQKEELDLDVQTKLIEGRKRIEAEVKQREGEAHRMKDREKDQLIEKMAEQVKDLQQKMEQGSMQLQGEVQELELRELLETLFRNDAIEEVVTGANGADVLHHVHDRVGRPCGMIAYESKRTKAFSDKWIEKLKGDMHRHKAEIGVIVTEAMPKDMACMGLRDGVFICSFSELRGLAQVLRQSLLQLAQVRAHEQNKDGKAEQLYAFFTSPEFQRRMQVIVDGYAVMKQQLDTEKRLMQKQWAARDKQLEALVISASVLHGSILGIAGNTMEAITEGEQATELI